MGKKDTITKEYMSEPEYFADAFNYFMFDGMQMIDKKNLSVMDAAELGLIFAEENKEIIQKVRDVLKECVIMEDEKSFYLILGIENQSNVHYAMPVKNMIYDALNYGRQASEQAKRHKKEKDIQGSEFISGFSKMDKLKPVITLVVYFGTEEWDAPRSLKEMFEEVNEDVLKYVSDYKVNLLIPKEIDDFSKFKTEFGKAMKYISVSDNKEACEIVANEEPYKVINVETARLLNECVGMNIVVEKGANQMKVCEAVKGFREEGRLEGRLEGIQALVKTLQEMGQTNDFIIKTVVEKFSLSEKEAMKYIK